MFKKILIANRGEIACRVIKTARRMGIATVAVCSEADANARHVRSRMRPCSSGRPPPRSLPARRQDPRSRKGDGCRSHPPGLRFPLRERRLRRCLRASRHRVHRAARFRNPRHGLEVSGEGVDGEGAGAAVPRLSRRKPGPDLPCRARRRPSATPCCIKASAGGGGKGMRRVDDAADFDAALASCKREAPARSATSAAGGEISAQAAPHRDPGLRRRQGNVVYLFERDCSVQRRHQKVLEEAPAPGMTPQRRAAMGKAAVDAAKAVGYVGAGTVEFIANQDGSVLLHGDEHPPAGRASGDRDDHRARSGRVAAACRHAASRCR